MKNNPSPGSTAKVYCQIVSHDATAHTCHMTQGQEGCFGCASPHRLCEKCQKKIVTIPAIGMCSSCAAAAQAEELASPPMHIDPKVQVHCQMMKFKISGAMCQAKQGDRGCARCAVQTRKCEMCKERTVRFPRYGLCLTCTVKKFGEEVSLAVPMITRPPVVQPSTVVSRSQEAAPTLNATGAQPPATVALDLEDHAERKTIETPPEGEDMEKKKFDNLVARARRVVVKAQKASAGFLQEELHISRPAADKVMDELASQGVISSNGINRYRKVLISTLLASVKPKRSNKRKALSTLEARVQKALPAARAHILKRGEAHTRILKELHIGGDVIAVILRRLEDEGFISKRERGIPRRVLVSDSTDRKGQRQPTNMTRTASLGVREKKLSLIGRARVEEVLPEAKVLILKTGITHNKFLKRVLHVGNEVASEIVRRLEVEGFLGKLGPDHTRKIRGSYSSMVPRREGEYPRVLQFIACIGEETELARELFDLLGRSTKLASIVADIQATVGSPR